MAKRGVVVAAATAGVVAAGLVVVLYLRPEWRRLILGAGRHLLNAAEHFLPQPGETGAGRNA